MGKLLHRCWTPFLLAEEIAEPDCPPVRIKLMGERLIAFRDSKGRFGLIDEFCDACAQWRSSLAKASR
jgi:phthalate 4,5-dioxygenase oxygenase subunit